MTIFGVLMTFLRISVIFLAGNAVLWWAEIRILTVFSPMFEKIGLFEIDHVMSLLFAANLLLIFVLNRLYYKKNPFQRDEPQSSVKSAAAGRPQ
ncbi:hypothetical protein [Bacillus marinisedimentorum]|uniref:hypothetical protein n=1 Tax=Bacillus marinisedimentorum TaxID=1821260 RepID=UPI000872441C|nr:hypothetical protein [Bacillus marinisedimentorum]